MTGRRKVRVGVTLVATLVLGTMGSAVVSAAEDDGEPFVLLQQRHFLSAESRADSVAQRDTIGWISLEDGSGDSLLEVYDDEGNYSTQPLDLLGYDGLPDERVAASASDGAITSQTAASLSYTYDFDPERITVAGSYTASAELSVSGCSECGGDVLSRASSGIVFEVTEAMGARLTWDCDLAFDLMTIVEDADGAMQRGEILIDRDAACEGEWEGGFEPDTTYQMLSSAGLFPLSLRTIIITRDGVAELRGRNFELIDNTSSYQSEIDGSFELVMIPPVPVATTQATVPTTVLIEEPAVAGIAEEPVAGESAADDGTGGIPWIPIVVAVGLLGGGVAVATRDRKPAADDPCAAQRAASADADRAVASAERRSAAAAARLRRASSELAAAQTQGSVEPAGPGSQVVPMLGWLGAGREDVASFALSDGGDPRWPDRVAPPGAILVTDAGQLGLDATCQSDVVIEVLTGDDAPFGAHVLVTPTDIVPLLPDRASVRPWTNALVAVATDPDDTAVLERLASVVAAWRREHSIDDVSAGRVGGTPSRLDLNSLPDAPPTSRGAIPVGVVPAREPGSGAGTGVQAREAEADAARAELEAAREDERSAREAASAAARRLEECEGAPVAVAPTPIAPDDDATGEDDEDDRETRWFLLERENPYSPVRENGKRGWYHATRRQPVSGIVVHTAESDAGFGHAVAEYFATTERPASAHVIADVTGVIGLLPDEVTAWHAKGGNSRGLGIEIQYRADNWGSNAIVEEALVRVAAAWCGMKALQYGIPPVRVTAAEWKAGARGFVAHGDLDPERRHDPGGAFPWDDFLRRVASITGR